MTPFGIVARRILVGLVASRAALSLVGIVASYLVPPATIIPALRVGMLYHEPTTRFPEIWARWDSEWYALIAEHGYGEASYSHYRDQRSFTPIDTAGFFPLYPMLMRVCNLLTGNSIVSGFVLSNVFLFFAMFFVYRIAESLFSAEAADTSVLYYLVYPMGFFLSALYSESLFLFLTTAAVYAAMRGRWPLAALAGLLSAVARPNGILTALPVLLLYLQSVRWRPKGAFWPILAVASFPVGFFAVIVYFKSVFGNFIVFFARQIAWRQGGLLDGFIGFFKDPRIHTWRSSAIDVTFALAAVGLCVLAWRRLPLWLNAYNVVHIAPLVAASLLSVGRQNLTLFPLFIGLAVLAGRGKPRTAILCSFPVLQGLFMALFACWYWVA